MTSMYLKTTRINPMEFPLEEGESWWVVHPNSANSEFVVPNGAITVCTEGFFVFKTSTVYNITGNDSQNGWITLMANHELVEMPYYVFARYFDAEAFVRGRFTTEGKQVEPFDYKPTLPNRRQGLLFEDIDSPKPKG